MSTDYQENKRLVELNKKANDARYEAHSKSNLKRHIEKKFKTTMIGALCRFEKEFGHLWGHGLPDHELDDDQLLWKEKWQLVRTEILNNGNNQLRAALLEIDQNTIKYNKLQYQFKLTKDIKEITEDE